VTKATTGQESIEAAAARWVVRLGGESLSDAEKAAFERWLRESNAHAVAFEFARTTWRDLGVLSYVQTLDETKLVRPTRRTRSARESHKCGQRPLWTRTAVAASLFLIVTTGGVYYSGNHLLIALVADHRTASGELRTVTLSDGSTADLNTASAIKLHFTNSERRVELLAGEALFSVAPAKHAEDRPFTVVASGGTTRALGTRFLVHRRGDLVSVTDIEHRIEVSVTKASGQRESVTLDPGQAVEFNTASGLGTVVKLDAERAAAWQRGRLLFDRAPLDNVIAELNRYRRGTIIIANRDLARRKVSAVFRLDDLDRALGTIVAELGARSAGLPPLVTVIY